MDIPADVSTTAVLPLGLAFTSGIYERLSDEDWYRFQGKRGQPYAIELRADNPKAYASVFEVIVYDRAGRRLTDGTGDFEGPAGAQFKPTYDGTYFVGVKLTYFEQERPGYRVRIAKDCGQDRSTQCGTTVGATYAGDLLTPDDIDLVKVRLAPDSRYDVTISSPEPYAGGDYYLVRLALLDRTGKQLAECTTGSVDRGELETCTLANLRSTYDGPYFIRFDTPTPYRTKVNVTVRKR